MTKAKGTTTAKAVGTKADKPAVTIEQAKALPALDKAITSLFDYSVAVLADTRNAVRSFFNAIKASGLAQTDAKAYCAVKFGEESIRTGIPALINLKNIESMRVYLVLDGDKRYDKVTAQNLLSFANRSMKDVGIEKAVTIAKIKTVKDSDTGKPVPATLSDLHAEVTKVKAVKESAKDSAAEKVNSSSTDELALAVNLKVKSLDLSTLTPKSAQLWIDTLSILNKKVAEYNSTYATPEPVAVVK